MSLSYNTLLIMVRLAGWKAWTRFWNLPRQGDNLGPQSEEAVMAEIERIQALYPKRGCCGSNDG